MKHGIISAKSALSLLNSVVKTVNLATSNNSNKVFPYVQPNYFAHLSNQPD